MASNVSLQISEEATRMDRMNNYNKGN
jgi:hypothetical protein